MAIISQYDKDAWNVRTRVELTTPDTKMCSTIFDPGLKYHLLTLFRQCFICPSSVSKRHESPERPVIQWFVACPIFWSCDDSRSFVISLNNFSSRLSMILPFSRFFLHCTILFREKVFFHTTVKPLPNIAKDDPYNLQYTINTIYNEKHSERK